MPEFLASTQHSLGSTEGITILVEHHVASGESFNPAHFARLFELESQSFWFRGRSDLIEWALRTFLPETRTFMEVGCGTGYVLSRLEKKFPGVEFSGSELFLEGLQFARQRLPSSVALYQLDATDMPFLETFDAMGAFDVIEHIPDDDLVLKNLYCALRPGGGLLLTVPQHKWLWSDTDVAACHVRRYEKASLLNSVQSAGFVIEKVTSFVFFLLPAMLLARLRRRDGTAEVEAELNLPGPINGLGYLVLSAENALIRAGLTLPAGGSLLVVARKPFAGHDRQPASQHPRGPE